MNDQFIQNEWEQLCERVVQTAIHVDTESDEGTSLLQAKEFCDQEPPNRYTQLLDRVRGAAELAVSWQTDDEPVRDAENTAARQNSKSDSLPEAGDLDVG